MIMLNPYTLPMR